MHYYAFNIGDYTSHTAHLSPIEDIAYRRLLDLYYQTESPIPTDLKAVCRQIRMREHESDVHVVLQEFFELAGDAWVNQRCAREIADYHAKAEKSRANGKRGGRPKKQNETQMEPRNNQLGFSSFHLANPEVTQTEPREKLTNNHKPITNNQETEIQEYSAAEPLPSAIASAKSQKVLKPESVDAQTWKDFLKIRSANRAPLTATAWKKIESEAAIAGCSIEQALQTCCERGWRSFKAEWVSGKQWRQAKTPLAENFDLKNYGEGIELI